MKNKDISEDYLRELGHRFKIIRTFLKLDQSKMSQLLNIGQSQLSKIEAGRSAPTIYQLIRLKKISEEDNYLRESLTWEWILEGKGKGIIG